VLSWRIAAAAHLLLLLQQPANNSIMAFQLFLMDERPPR
jgi:hypothetical protein